MLVRVVHDQDWIQPLPTLDAACARLEQWGYALATMDLSTARYATHEAQLAAADVVLLPIDRIAAGSTQALHLLFFAQALRVRRMQKRPEILVTLEPGTEVPGCLRHQQEDLPWFDPEASLDGLRPCQRPEAERWTLRDRAPGDEAACEAIMRRLPTWFGIEQAILTYRREIAEMETLVAVNDEATVEGFLTLHHHGPGASEVQVMAVAPEARGQGLGRWLLENAEARLRARNVRFLQVKTVGPSREDASYARTRGFYEAVGFTPLEEHDLWGPTNPCLVLVKALT